MKQEPAPGAGELVGSQAGPGRRGLSVIILAQNEEKVIGRCIGSVAALADEILVVDSGSTDGTRAVAEAAGARVSHRAWPGYHALQKNAAMEDVAHDWILHLDADEIVDRDLARAILEVLASDPDPSDAWALQRRGEFCGVEIPTRPRPKRRLDLVRLFHRGFSRFDPEALVHETVIVPGRVRLCPGLLYHWRAFTLTQRFEQYNKYASVEALIRAKAGRQASVLRLLFMPPARFGWHYFLDGSWRVGWTGLIHAMSAASGEFMREAKLWELQRVQPPEPEVPILRVGGGRC